jgi:uncharacterized protein (TIGR00299 family) protein
VSRLVYFDCASGASGDMLLGALVDLGLPIEALRDELGKLPLRGYSLEARRVHRAGLHATKVEVVVPAAHHHHRGLKDILGLLEKSALEAEVKAKSAELFERLAVAEATVHGTSPEQVHFHEVGAVDSIVDIVGGVIGLRWLKADRFVASALNVGTGTVTMSHGTYPVPPPATLQLVKGVPTYGAGVGELLTPTGALLITGHATSYGHLPLLKPEHIGHGAGSRETDSRPNVLRLIVGEEEATASEIVLVLEAEIDDMSPQLFGPLIDRLLAAGALDAYLTPVQMKKGRPGVLVTVLSGATQRTAVEDVLFRETTTLGVRWQEWKRSVLERERVMVATAYGPIAVKLGKRGSDVLNAQPEFDDCQKAASAHGVPVKEVWAAALAAFRSAPPA